MDDDTRQELCVSDADGELECLIGFFFIIRKQATPDASVLSRDVIIG